MHIFDKEEILQVLWLLLSLGFSVIHVSHQSRWVTPNMEQAVLPSSSLFVLLFIRVFYARLSSKSYFISIINLCLIPRFDRFNHIALVESSFDNQCSIKYCTILRIPESQSTLKYRKQSNEISSILIGINKNPARVGDSPENIEMTSYYLLFLFPFRF